MKKRGFTIVEAILILAILGIIGALGYTAYTHFVAKKPTTTTPPVTTTQQSATTVSSASDLDKATSDLNALDLTDSSETTTIDSQTNGL